MVCAPRHRDDDISHHKLPRARRLALHDAGGLLIADAGRQEGWRWIFYVNLVAGLIAVPAAARFLPKPVRRSRTSGDLAGAGLLTAGLMLILFPLIEGRPLNWPTWSYLCLAASAPVLGSLAVWEKRVATRGARPLIPPRVVTRRSFAQGGAFALLYFASFTSIFFMLAVVWQDGFRHGALASGLIVTPVRDRRDDHRSQQHPPRGQTRAPDPHTGLRRRDRRPDRTAGRLPQHRAAKRSRRQAPLTPG